MQPTRNTEATIVDLLDRILDKGVILDADVIIHVAGIPLLGLKLRAALAGMETMLEYGIWNDWDAAQRAVASQEYSRRQAAVPARTEGGSQVEHATGFRPAGLRGLMTQPGNQAEEVNP